MVLCHDKVEMFLDSRRFGRMGGHSAWPLDALPWLKPDERQQVNELDPMAGDRGDFTSGVQ